MRSPIGPTAIGCLDPDVQLEPGMVDIAWRNEIGSMARQLTPLLLEVFNPYQLLNYFIFSTVQMAEQIRAANPPSQAAIDYLNYMVTAAHLYHQSVLKSEAYIKHAADPDKAPLFLDFVDEITPVERDTLAMLVKNFVDKQAAPVQ